MVFNLFMNLIFQPNFHYFKILVTALVGRVSFFPRRPRSAPTTRQNPMNSIKRNMPEAKKGNMGRNAEPVEGEDLPTNPASLPVPNVQEMVRKTPMEVPERYIRHREDRPKATEITRPPCQIPVIDLSLLSIGHKEELQRLDLACKQWGFFQVPSSNTHIYITQTIVLQTNIFSMLL